MQARAGKAPKREMVIESPQQYKCLAEIEAEVEAGSQVAAVSDAESKFILKVQFGKKEEEEKKNKRSQMAPGFYQWISSARAALKRS